MAKLILGFVLIDFLAVTGWALSHHGFVGFFGALTASPAAIAVGTDLVIALGLITVWMWRDAKAHDRAVLPYVGLTATLGSVGPLAYLLLDGEPGGRRRLLDVPERS